MRVSLSIIFLAWLNACLCVGQELSIPIKVTCGSDSQILYFGLDPRGTDGLDPSLGESPLPPLPPKGGFDARINLPSPSLDSSIKDYRFGNTKSFTARISYEIQFQPGNSSAIDISWSLPAGIAGTIQDKYDGLVVKKAMTGTGVLTITNTAINKLDIIFDYNFKSTGIEGVLNNPEYLPSALNLSQNYPNPFNPTTQISWKIIEAGNVSIKVYDALGNEVSTIVDGFYQPGNYNSTFNTQRYSLSTGVYFYTITSDKFSLTKKMVFSK